MFRYVGERRHIRAESPAFSSSTITSPGAFVFVFLAPNLCRSNRFCVPVSFVGGAAPVSAGLSTG